MTESVRINRLSEFTSYEPTYLAIGSFDGVHLGHQALLGRMVKQAQEDGRRAAALTFFPHPRRVLQELPQRFYITTLEERLRLLAAEGVGLVITLPFNDEIRQTRAADFMAQLCRSLDLRQLWGGRFALGYNREGDVPFLRHLGQEMGFTVEVVDAMTTWQEELVSSRRVRRTLEAGNISELNGCLGRPYALSGVVVRSDQRGRTIGFPTANLAVWEELLLPAYGVYATYAWLDGRRFLAATNVGVRPTVDGQRLTVEAYLLDFDEDIYGQTMQLDFIGHIRPEMKFSGLEALKAQIADDVAAVREQLGQTDYA
jgi:riboflavin kinase/FMN adenylyltransferase